MNPLAPRWHQALAFSILLLVTNSTAWAQFASTIRLTSPIGRTVVEIRKGTQPANPRLLFTAAITAGPTGGTTSLLLQQAFLEDIFNPAAPAAGWTTVLSTSTAFSLGGGCGRNNLIDFPFINNNRPQILRITGTTQQVITLGIAGNDQYDSIDCVVQGNGQVLYMLTNRTLSKLELRREQGGLLQLVRDNFGVVITPFVGGMRPSFSLVRRPVVALEPDGTSGAPIPDGQVPRQNDFVMFFLERIVPNNQLVKILAIFDDEPLTTRATCNGASAPAPTGFTIPKESAATGGVAVGPSRNSNVLWGDYFVDDSGNCVPVKPAESLGTAGPFSLYTWTGIVANQPPLTDPRFPTTTFTLLITPSTITTFDNGTRTNYANPLVNRGGPVTGCLITGSEFDAAQLAIGPGPSNTQVQHSLIPVDILDRIFGSSAETVWGGTLRCE